MLPQLFVLATVLVSSSSFKRFTDRLATMNKLLSVRIVRAAKGGVGVLALLAGLSMPALAETYPGRPVTLVVPFPPGGVADTVGRPVAESMGQFLGQPIVVDNKAGAGGGIGMAHVARSKPDGLTL
jgi:tripartite-type tricarboxylate transporter receptor subunit TctC